MIIKIKKYTLFLLLFYFILFFSEGKVFSMDSNDKYLKFNQSFKNAEPKMKRDLVIKAIDDGLIKRGLSLELTKRLFGDALNVIKFGSPDPDPDYIGVVDFETVTPLPKSSHPLATYGHKGWHFDIYFSASDVIERYYLTNLQKVD